MARVNKTRLRRSGMRNTLANASKNFMVPSLPKPLAYARGSVPPITPASPPAALIFSSADFENRCASTRSLRVNWPDPRTFNPSWSFLMTPCSRRWSGVNVSPSSFSSLSRLMIAYCFLKIFVKPRLGKRRCSGIWPPSKPRFWPKPVPARCPLLPRVAVLPWPDPIPRPIRLRTCFCPAGGFNPLRFIRSLLFHYLQQMRDFLDHAAEDRRIRPHHDLIELAKPQPKHHALVLLRRADRTAIQLDLNHAIHKTKPFSRRCTQIHADKNQDNFSAANGPNIPGVGSYLCASACICGS